MITVAIIIFGIVICAFFAALYAASFVGLLGRRMQYIARFPTIILTIISCSLHGLELKPPKYQKEDEESSQEEESRLNHEEEDSDNKRGRFWCLRGDTPVQFLKRLNWKSVNTIQPLEIFECSQSGARRETSEEWKARKNLS